MLENKVKTILQAGIFFLIAGIFVGVISVMLWTNHKIAEEKEWDTGWEVTVNGERLEKKDTIEEYKFEKLKMGDQVKLYKTIPWDTNNHQTMTLLVYLSTIQVQVDGDVIYSYGKNYAKENKLVGSGYHFITIPAGSQGRQMVVTLEVREKNAFTNIMAPSIANTKDAYENFASRNILGMGICMFLTFLGGLLLLVSVVAYCFNPIFLRLIYIGVFSFLMGIWSMCNMKLLQIFHIDMASNTLIEYMTLYFAPVSFMLLIAEIRKNADAWKRQVAYGAALLLFLFAVIVSVMQFANIEHYPNFLGYFHIFGAISLLIIAVTAYDKKRSMDRSNRSIYIGLLALTAIIVLDLLRFNLQKYMFQDNESLSYSIIPVGTLIFIICLLISYVFYIYGMLMEKASQEWLAERAYHDELCGVFNRTKCSEIFKELDSSKKDYAMISIDINGLKVINDTLGHSKGDELLKEFAQILKTVFKDIGHVIRMGGDEFLVVVEQEQFPQIDQCLNRMVKMEKRRSAELVFVIDSSYGVAKKSECPEEQIERVYSLADQRMYEMKAKKKINKRLRK